MFRTARTATLFALIFAAGLVTVPPADAGTLTLSPTSGTPGTSVSATGSGFARRTTGQLKFGDSLVSTVTTNRRGVFSAQFATPSVSAGPVTVTATIGSDTGSQAFTVIAPPAPAPAGSYWRPGPATTWQMQLTTPVDQSVSADFYVIDGFDNDASVVASLHGQGRHVGCYLSVGSYEDWRPDAASFPAAVLGKSNGWPGERWLDIRRLDLLGPIMEARMDMCRAKGYDAVDPDNVDGYTNATGFPLTAADQLAYNRFIADAAHVRGMAVGLKNDLDQVATLAPSFDFSVNEQCFEYSECNLLTPFVAAGKPVFNIEYRGDPAVICPQARSLGLLSQMKRLSLDAWRTVC